MADNYVWVIPVIMGIAALIGIAFVTIFTVIVIRLVKRNAAAAEEAGLDPWAAGTQLQGRLYNSALLDGAEAAEQAPRVSLQERLDEIERLYAAGAITPEERDLARRAALTDG